MTEWEWTPNIAIGTIRFGMSRDELRQSFSGPYTEYKKSKYSKNTADDYGGFHVYYTPENTVEAVEIFEGIHVIYQGKQLFPSSKEDALKTVDGLEEDAGVYMQPEKSIGFAMAGHTVESVLLGAKDYYK